MFEPWLVKIEKIFFYLLIFSLPFQKRAIIYITGVEFNEWNTLYLYLTDMILAVVLVGWLWRLKKQKIILGQADYLLLGFLLLVLLSVIRAQNQILALYQWFKLLEFSLLFFYIRHNFDQLYRLKDLLIVFIGSGLLQAIIAIAQFFYQKSLGLYIFEESILGPQVVGVAKIDMPGFEILRSYGTFPHANPLALFILLTLISLVVMFSTKQYQSLKYRLLFTTVSFLFVLAFLMSFSRAIALIAALLFLAYSAITSKRVLSLILLLNILTVSWLLYPELTHRYDPKTIIDSQAVNFRLFYNDIAIAMIKNSPFWGVGAGNFVWRSADFWSRTELIEAALKKDGLGAWIFQPAHNVFLLIGAEVGMLGLVVFLLFLLIVFKQFLLRLTHINYKNYSILCILCLVALFFIDHYLWTLQQGSLLLWIGLGLLAAESVKNGSLFSHSAPIAQLDRASASGAEG